MKPANHNIPKSAERGDALCAIHRDILPYFNPASTNQSTLHACLIKRKGNNMYHLYYINKNRTFNPGLHHEVHTLEHAEQLRIRDLQYVGYFPNEIEAVSYAKNIYVDADGCAICCPRAHRG